MFNGYISMIRAKRKYKERQGDLIIRQGQREGKNIEISAIFRVPQMKLKTQGQKIIEERQRQSENELSAPSIEYKQNLISLGIFKNI